MIHIYSTQSQVLAAVSRCENKKSKAIAISRSTIRRTRIKHRLKIAKNIKATFDPVGPLERHWDGKMLPNIIEKQVVDRVAVVVTGENIEKLLGVPKLPSSSGSAQTDSFVNLVNEGSVTDKIKALSFDNTSSNTGINNGACTLIMKKLNTSLLHLAFRHHIFELLVEKTFIVCLGPSSGPDIGLFESFQQMWTFIDQSKFITLMDIENIIDPSIVKELLEFGKDCLTSIQPRDDYRETLKLWMIILGDKQPEGKDIFFIQAGALHRARWMAKLIYDIKIFLFHEQFSLTNKEKTGLLQFLLFVTHVYLKVWFQAPQAVCATRVDLQLLKDIKSYTSVNKNISKAVLETFPRHQWYLSEELTGLAFFDKEVPIDTRRKMVNSLHKKGSVPCDKRIVIKPEEINDNLSLDLFVTENTKQFFIMLGIETEFLDKDPKEWESMPHYQRGKQIAKSLKVVNDVAERGVALIQNFNGVLTKYEEQKQYLLQVVEDHRKKFPDTKKITLFKDTALV